MTDGFRQAYIATEASIPQVGFLPAWERQSMGLEPQGLDQGDLPDLTRASDKALERSRQCRPACIVFQSSFREIVLGQSAASVGSRFLTPEEQQMSPAN